VLVLEIVRFANFIEFLVRVTCSAPCLTKSVRNTPLAVVPGFSRFLCESHTPLSASASSLVPQFGRSARITSRARFATRPPAAEIHVKTLPSQSSRDSPVSFENLTHLGPRSRNPRENTQLGCCSFRKNTVMAFALLLDVSVSSRYPREKHSARCRRSPRNHPFRESARRCSNLLFPQQNVLESLVHVRCSAPPLDLPVPSRTSHTNAPLGVVARSVLDYRLFRTRLSLVSCVLASFACQLDSAKVFTERRRSTDPDIAGPRAYR